jgi:hypothetical protein
MIRFLVLVSVSIFLMGISDFFVIDTEVVFNSLSGTLPREEIVEIIESGRKWQWLRYCLSPITHLIKILIVSLCLSVGLLQPAKTFYLEKFF